jgi:hypothetical protein
LGQLRATHPRIVLASTPTLLAASSEPIHSSIGPRGPGPSPGSAASWSKSARTRASSRVRSIRTTAGAVPCVGARREARGRMRTLHRHPTALAYWPNAAPNSSAGPDPNERPAGGGATTHTLQLRCRSVNPPATKVQAEDRTDAGSLHWIIGQLPNVVTCPACSACVARLRPREFVPRRPRATAGTWRRLPAVTESRRPLKVALLRRKNDST